MAKEPLETPGDYLGLATGLLAALLMIVMIALLFSRRGKTQPFASKVFPTSAEQVGYNDDDGEEELLSAMYR